VKEEIVDYLPLTAKEEKEEKQRLAWLRKEELEEELRLDEKENNLDELKKEQLALITKGVFKEKLIGKWETFKFVAGKKKRRTHILKRVFFLETVAEKLRRKLNAKKRRLEKFSSLKKKAKFFR
jgi:hypothetical protein